MAVMNDLRLLIQPHLIALDKEIPAFAGMTLGD